MALVLEAVLAEPVAEMREQLAALVTKQFLQSTPSAWIPHLPRFLKAMSIRLQKLLNAGLMRDRQIASQINPLWRAYLERGATPATRAVYDPELQTFRWMIEELRVSLFAQELKTSMAVSLQRLERQFRLVAP